jgi:hypothetical protein
MQAPAWINHAQTLNKIGYSNPRANGRTDNMGIIFWFNLLIL